MYPGHIITTLLAALSAKLRLDLWSVTDSEIEIKVILRGFE